MKNRKMLIGLTLLSLVFAGSAIAKMVYYSKLSQPEKTALQKIFLTRGVSVKDSGVVTRLSDNRTARLACHDCPVFPGNTSCTHCDLPWGLGGFTVTCKKSGGCSVNGDN